MINNWDRFLLPYAQAVEELKVKFKSIRKEYNDIEEYSPIEFVTGRVKKVASIIEKLKLRGLTADRADELEDIAGIRIICQLIDDIPRVVDMIRQRDGKDLKIVEVRDYITNKKPSGYESYHIIIRYWVHTASGEKEILAEIQIRTLAMNFWATIEHSLNYKFGENLPEHIQLRLKNSAVAASMLDREMSEIRDEIMDAQSLFLMRSALTSKILNKIQSLYFSGDFDNVREFQARFNNIREHDDIEELRVLNRDIDKVLQNSFINIL